MVYLASVRPLPLLLLSTPPSSLLTFFLPSSRPFPTLHLPAPTHPTRSVPYAALVTCFTKIESTSSRLEIISYLTQFFLLVIQRAGAEAPEEKDDPKGKGKEKAKKDGLGAAENVLKVVYLSINRVGKVSYRFEMKSGMNGGGVDATDDADFISNRW